MFTGHHAPGGRPIATVSKFGSDPRPESLTISHLLKIEIPPSLLLMTHGTDVVVECGKLAHAASTTDRTDASSFEQLAVRPGARRD